MKEQTARFGLLGTGVIIREYHLPSLLANPRAEVTALGNLRPESLKKLAADCGIHLVSFVFHDSVRPLSVYAQGGNFFQEADVEDTANVTIVYDNGVTAMIEAGWYHNHFDGPEGSVQVFGSRGYARTFPTELYTELGGEWGRYEPVMPPRAQQCDLPMYAAQAQHFIDCVLENARPEADARQGRRGMVLLEAAYRSMQSGSSVDVEGCQEPPPDAAGA